MMSLISEYLYIIDNELRMAEPANNLRDALIGEPNSIKNTAKRILEIAENSTVLRCGNRIGHLTRDTIAYESDGAHTNLVRAIANYALDFVYGWGESPGFTRREIDEAILIHDLPENVFDDIPDNGSRDELQKLKDENAYYAKFLEYYEPYDRTFVVHIAQLLCEMNAKSTEIGRIIYLADKLSAIIMMLAYDNLDMLPRANPSESSLSSVSRTEINLCELRKDNSILLSELWTVDFLFGRELNQYDDTGFFTALLVMATLLVHDKWYQWREDQYLA